MGKYDMSPKIMEHQAIENIMAIQALGPNIEAASVTAQMLPSFSPGLLEMVKSLGPAKFEPVMTIWYTASGLQQARFFIHDGRFWQYLAYFAGTVRGMFVTGSAAGVYS